MSIFVYYMYGHIANVYTIIDGLVWSHTPHAWSLPLCQVRYTPYIIMRC